MIQVILFDCDGLIIRHEKYFSIRLAEEQGVVLQDENEKQKAFFKGIFLECEIGKADLKEELSKDLSLWSWPGSTESLMEYWFSGERTLDNQLKDYILNLRKRGIKTFLSTNNEKYRAEYLWNEVGLKEIFDGYLPSWKVGSFKDEQEFWEKSSVHFPDVSKKDILVWDDDLPNVESAEKFGFNAEFYKDFKSFKKTMKEKYQL